MKKKNNLVPNNDNENNLSTFANSTSIANLLYSLPAMEYEVIMLASKGLTSKRITNYILNSIENQDYEEEYFLGKKIGDDIDESDLKAGIEEYLDNSEIKLFIHFLQTQSNNKVFRKAQIDNIVFEVYLESIKRIKKGEIKELSLPQLINFGEKMLKSLHLEEDRNKEDVKDGIKLIKEYHDILNINSIITDEVGFNFYDETFFGTKTANNTTYVTPDDVINIDHSDDNDRI